MFGLVRPSPIPTSVPTGNEPLPYVTLAPLPAVTSRFGPDSMLPSDNSAQVDDRRARLTGATPASRPASRPGTGDAAMGLVGGGVLDQRGTSGPLDSPRSSYGSGLVHRQRQGTSVHDMVERSLGHVPGSGILRSASRMGVPGTEEEGASGRGAHANSAALCPPRDIRRHQVESEQRRRNELRSGFARLKEALPTSDKKCSKLALLERAAIYIGHLEARLREKQDPHGEIQ
ncbi:hypothetical protein FRC12_023711 [Ceratobasidium sp. 428]|nr:hypothetical protein FRC12_023711 [Ceratobasidium sp. 428]